MMIFTAGIYLQESGLRNAPRGVAFAPQDFAAARPKFQEDPRTKIHYRKDGAISS